MIYQMEQSGFIDKDYVPKKEKLAFGLAGGGQNFCYALIANYLLYYYVNVLHINARIVGIMFLFQGIWGLVNGPVAGIIIDRTRSKHGKMIPYLRSLSAPLALLTVLIFAEPLFIKTTSPTASIKIIYMVLTYFLWENCFTITNVAYWGLSTAISPSPSERTKVLAFTNVMINIMSAIPVVVVPTLLDYIALKDTHLSLSTAFFVFGVFGGGVGISLFSLSGFLTKERVNQSEKIPGIKEIFLDIFTNPILKVVVASNFILALSGITYAFSTYYFIDVLGYASLSFITQIPLMIFSFITLSLMQKIKNRWNNKQIMITVFLTQGMTQLIIYLIGIRHHSNITFMIPLLLIYYAVLGVCSALLNVIPVEIIGEATDYSEWKTGIRNEGTNFSLRITTTKIQATISQSIASMLLPAIGYVTSSSNARVVQTAQVQSNIWGMFLGLPSVLTLLCAIPYLFYHFVGNQKAKMYEELEIQRKTANNNAES